MSRWNPEVVAPSGKYGFAVPSITMKWEQPGAIIQVVQNIKGEWHPTPARYNLSTIAQMDGKAPLAIDYGQAWSLTLEDTKAFIAFAKSMGA